MYQDYRKLIGVLGVDILQDDEGDIVFLNGDIQHTIGTQGVMQRIYNKILSFPRSLYAHQEWGGFFQSLVSRNMTSSMVNEVKSAGQREFLSEPEVLDVRNFAVTPYREVHQLDVTGKIRFVTELDYKDFTKTLDI